jgi:hypothetical protein
VKSAVILLAILAAAPLARAQESYGTIKATTKLRPDGSSSTTIIDPDKRTAEETINDAAGKPLRKITYLLGERDLAIGAIFADAKGNVTYKASYQRDAFGNVTESSFTAPDGRYLGKRVFTYGTGNQVTQVQDFDPQGRLITPAPAASGKPAKKRR